MTQSHGRRGGRRAVVPERPPCAVHVEWETVPSPGELKNERERVGSSGIIALCFMQGPPGSLWQSKVLFPSNLGLILQAGNSSVFPRGGVSEGALCCLLVHGTAACLGETITASQNRRTTKTKLISRLDKMRDYSDNT